MGQLSVKGGDFNQSLAGLLEVDLGGRLLGESDHLDVQEGVVGLDGGLRVSLVDPLGGSNVFMPTARDQFTIISAAGGRTGTFFAPAIELPILSGALTWNVLYEEDRVLLEVLSPYSADFDGDGDVDSNDLAVWQASYALGNGADADDDGDSDGRDFVVWQRQYTGPGLLVTNATAVPEPSTWMLLSIAVAVGQFARQRRIAPRSMSNRSCW